jgi:hypothetical protein
MAKRLENGCVVCEQCDSRFERVGSHWARSQCNHSEIADYKIKILRGFLLGDGYLSRQCGNPNFEIRMINREFLEWVDKQLGWISTGVSMVKTAKESAENTRKFSDVQGDVGKHQDVYSLTTRSHPSFSDFEQWYDGGRSMIPDDIEVSTTALKVWFVSDGNVNFGNPQARIRFTSQTEANNGENISHILKSHGFDVLNTGPDFYIPAHQTDEFLNYIGSALPGFEYKWETESFEKYQQKKNKVYQ